MDQRSHRQHSCREGRDRRAADAVDARHHQALRRDRGAHGRLVRRAPGRGARPARRERRRQVDVDERRLGHDDARRRHDRLRRLARRQPHAGAGTGPRDRDRPSASGAPPGHDGRREHPRGGRARASAASRSRRDEGDALAARRRPLPGPSRGPRLVAQRRPPPPARARQGVRRVAAAPDPRRADGAALAGFRRAPLHRRPQARGEAERPSSTSRTGWARFARSPIASRSCATARLAGPPRSRTSRTPTSSP